MKRSRLRRGPWRRKKNRPSRPGVTTPPPRNAAWKRLGVAIRVRDHHCCRRCGFSVLGRTGQVDHLVPRRLAPTPADADHPDNLALLCEACHSYKTQIIEPALYAADVGRFEEFLMRLGPPRPDGLLVLYAYTALTRSLGRDLGLEP